jgi:CspA family cold shock protein
MQYGKVKWFNNNRGYGFIIQENGEEFFCHITAIAGDGMKYLMVGDGVTFDIIKGPKGLQAANLRKV